MSLKYILSALPHISALVTPKLPSAQVIGQLAPPAFFENIAVRTNGDLLSTLIIGGPDIYTITNPSSAQHRSIHRIASIPNINALSGIAQLHSPDGAEVFVVTGGNTSSNLPAIEPVIGSFSAWTITFLSDGDNQQHVGVAKLGDLGEETAGPNGVATVLGAVLIADSIRGMVGRLDVATGEFRDDEFSFPEMLPTSESKLGIGVNGIKFHDGYLYFTNTATATIHRVAATRHGHLVPEAQPELVADVHPAASMLDDFTFDRTGHIYAATNLENTILYVNVTTGNSSIIVGSQSEWAVAGCSAVAFGRGGNDFNTLYVSAATTTIRGVTKGGRIIAVEL